MSKLTSRKKIKNRIRNKIAGNASRPRLSVFRSNKAIYAQIIDDTQGRTLCSSSSNDKNFSVSGTKKEIAKEVGKRLAESAKSMGIENIIFDRNGYLYHGRVQSLADGAREGGLIF